MAYNGTIDLISGIRQANSGMFPLVDATAVRVDDSTRLDEALGKLDNEVIVSDTQPSADGNKIWIADDNGTEYSVPTSAEMTAADALKADKVSSATSGHFAGLDANGNLTDSGHKHSDYLTSHQDISGKADKVTTAVGGNFAALDNGGNLYDSGHKHSDYLTSHQDIGGKADKVAVATEGNFAALDSTGNLTDSGHKHSDYATAAQASALLSDLNQKAPAIYESASGSIVSISDGADGMPLKACTINIEPVQSGTGDPSPTNVRPISGWTGAQVVRTGRNLFNVSAFPFTDEKNIDGSTGNYIDSSVGNSATEDYIPCGYLVGKTITLSPKPSGNYAGIAFYNSSKTYISGEIAAHFTANRITATVPSGAEYFRFCVPGTDKSVAMVELGSTASAYAPYTGVNTYPITWTSSGTVYGGTIDPVGGVLTVDRRYIVLDGTTNKLTASYGNSGPNWLPAYSLGSGADRSESSNGNLISTYLATVGYASSENSMCIGNSGQVIAIHIGTIQGTDGTHGYSSASECQAAANAYLADHNLGICYKLNTPVQITGLTPADITTLLGTNNLWADCGAVSVEYPADTELYIDRRIAASQAVMEMIVTANREDAMKATRAYSSGDLLIVNGTLYKASTSIANGATLTVGTNVTATTVAAELAALA